MSDGLRDIEQAAAYLGLTKSALYAKTAARSVPFTKIGRNIRFTQAHLDAIVAAGEQPVIESPAQLRLAGRSGRAA
jgi:excisionase family DNA binding protein